MVRYCGRFVSGPYCEECSCVDCHNNVENEDVRREATECVNCKNVEGSELGMDVLWGNHGIQKNNEEDFKNYLIKTGAVQKFMSSRNIKWRTQLEFTFPSLPFHTDLVCQFASSKASSSSKLACRSLLADAIHSLDDRELCSLLVVVSETAKFLAGMDWYRYTQLFFFEGE
ncbi:hypothetical protein NC651_008137 [Populus alba x Populus x berolinensis]|nr:hypothetical protein NC651_008137 [Populus alba x Populus x berolinensis]